MSLAHPRYERDIEADAERAEYDGERRLDAMRDEHTSFPRPTVMTPLGLGIESAERGSTPTTPRVHATEDVGETFAATNEGEAV